MLLVVLAPGSDTLDVPSALHPQPKGDCRIDIVLLQAGNREAVA